MLGMVPFIIRDPMRHTRIQHCRRSCPRWATQVLQGDTPIHKYIFAAF